MWTREHIAGLTLLLSLTAALYCNSFPGAFHYDDHPLLLEDPSITSEFPYSWFLESYGGRPLTLWTFHLNYRWFAADPTVYHAVSVTLHLLVTGLLYLLLIRETGAWKSSLAAALIFGIHPIQAQAVNYVWSRSVLLMALFSLSALWVVRSRHGRFFALVLFQAAVWSRAEALVLAVPLGLIDRASRKPLAVLVGLNLISLGAGLTRHRSPEVAWNYQGVFGYWYESLSALAGYLKLMVWPEGFTIFHGRVDASWWTPLLVLILLLVLARLVWLQRKEHPEPALGMAWVVLWLAPSLLIPNADAINESRAYLAMGGFSTAAAGLGGLLGSRLRQWRGVPGRVVASVAAVCGGAWLLWSAATTLDRNRLWQDDVAVWVEAVSVATTDYLPRYNLGVALARRGLITEAEASFWSGTQLNPSDDMGYSGLGFCAESRGQLQAAAGFYSHALSLNPRNTYAQEALERVTVNLELR